MTSTPVNLAEARGDKADVKDFGKQMVTDHTGVNRQTVALAKNEELKALIVKVRPAFVAHLERAKSIQEKLGQ